MNIIKNIKTQTANKILNSSFLFFIIFVNLIKFLTRDSIKGNLNKACGDISFQSLDLFKFKFYSITPSIFPEIYSEFDQLESVCFGIISKQDNLFDFTSFYFVGSNYLFMPFIIFFIFSTVLFLSKSQKINKKVPAGYLLIFFTAFNLVNFQTLQLSYIFSILVSVSSLVIISKSTLMNKKINSENFKQDYLVYLTSWTCILLIEMSKLMFREENLYHFSLWLTNYSQGYNRRGLLGSVATLLSNFFDPRIILMFIFTTIAASISYLIYYVLTSVKQNIISHMLLLSPAFISFYIHDIRGSFRKEFIGIFAFLYLTINLSKGKKLAIPLIFYYISIFSHPANLFLFPTIFLMLYKNKFNLKQIFLIALPLFLYIGSEYLYTTNTQFSLTYFCDEMNSKPKIIISCDDLDTQFVGTINGSSEDYIKGVQENISYKSFVYYLTVLLLAYIPFLTNSYFRSEKKFYAAYFFSFIPLFALAWDWGRYIVLFFITISILYLLDPKKPEVSNSKKYLFFIMIILYSFFWNFSHCCIDQSLPFSLDYFSSVISFCQLLFSEIFYTIYLFL